MSARPRSYQPGESWHNASLPLEIEAEHGRRVPHPGRECAIFVVHGIGRREWTETAAALRSGFEDALDKIKAWQGVQPRPFPPGAQVVPVEAIPPPFIHDGFWSNYQDLEATFKEEWGKFAPRERRFFDYLWKLRASVMATFFWFTRHQLRLLDFSVLPEVGPFVYVCIYFPLQIVATTALVLALFRWQKLYREFLVDVRMYVDPQGTVERAIVQRIDRRVGAAFLEMIGLDWNFRRLLPCDQIEVSGERRTFERVVWVAHSLGTVISFNVLSDLFHRAAELERDGDEEQQDGVRKFRKSLSRFVTLGSPLDKVAYLFGEKALRRFPEGDRRALLTSGESPPDERADQREWWINFYHVLDPISGSLGSDLICRDVPPLNFHVQSSTLSWLRAFLLPGWAHVDYWRDERTLRYVLGRTYGRKFLYDQGFRPWPPAVTTRLAGIGYVFWMLVLLAVIVIAVVIGCFQLSKLGLFRLFPSAAGGPSPPTS